VHDRVDVGGDTRDCGGIAHVDPMPGTRQPFRRPLPPRRDDVDAAAVCAPHELGAEVAAAAGDEEPCYQPRRSSSSPGSSEAVEIPTIASPRPAETSASTRASR